MRRKKGLCFYKRRKKVSSDAIREISNYFFGIGLALLMAFFLVYSFGMRTSVIGVSMENTLYNGQMVLVNKIAYLLFPPKAGDIVVFLPNGNANTHYYVKRVVATPGDKVEFRDGRLYVNDIMEENEQYDKVADPGIAEEAVTVGEDEFFVLGDNRNNSEDSRSGNIGLVKRDLIEGKVWFQLGHENQGMGFVN
ncbi:MAG: signal peptidase I [Lachnospiraceae bacterium]|nr:signal peptidase I [Lachnospiraceae bacterium]